eukprot:4434872-Amphidinium_carterae.3
MSRLRVATWPKVQAWLSCEAVALAWHQGTKPLGVVHPARPGCHFTRWANSARALRGPPLLDRALSHIA